MEERYELTGNWMKVLMYSAAVSVVNSLLNYLPIVPSAFTSSVSRGVMAVVILCMFRLANANGRYKTVGILRAIALSCLLMNDLIYSSAVMRAMSASMSMESMFSTLTAIGAVTALLSAVLAWVADYQEYKSHAELVELLDTGFAAKWRSLFFWRIAASVVISLGSGILTTVLVVNDLLSGAAMISGLITSLLSVPQIIVEVVYVLYLKKTAELFVE